jgi:hypothetical protein
MGGCGAILGIEGESRLNDAGDDASPSGEAQVPAADAAGDTPGTEVDGAVDGGASDAAQDVPACLNALNAVGHSSKLSTDCKACMVANCCGTIVPCVVDGTCNDALDCIFDCQSENLGLERQNCYDRCIAVDGGAEGGAGANAAFNTFTGCVNTACEPTATCVLR